MSRTLLVALIASLCLLPRPAYAQATHGLPGVSHGTPSGGSFGVTIRHDPPAPPNQPAPAPGVPLVPTAPPSAFDTADVFRAGPRAYMPRNNRSGRQRFYGGYSSGYGYLTDPFGYISQPYSRQPDAAFRDSDGTGYLRIEVEPDTAQVLVDGLYVGTVGDFRRGGRALDAGPHRVEIRAEGFDPQTVEVRIRPNDLLTYRGTLSRIEQRADLRPAAPAKTFFVIPRCYAGDSRPRLEQLPPGCRMSDLREVPPVVTRSSAQ